MCSAQETEARQRWAPAHSRAVSYTHLDVYKRQPYETFTQYSTTVSNVVKDARLQMMINPNLTAQELVDYVIENVRILEPTANVF